MDRETSEELCGRLCIVFVGLVQSSGESISRPGERFYHCIVGQRVLEGLLYKGQYIGDIYYSVYGGLRIRI